jgi:hypothetical protein
MEFDYKRGGFLTRLGILSLDLLFILILTVLLTRFTGKYFARRSVVMLKLGSPEGIWRGTIPMIISAAGYFFFGLPFSTFLVFLPEAFIGASPSKLIFRMRILENSSLHPHPKNLILRFVIKSASAWGLVLALLFGSLSLAIAFTAIGAVIFIGCFLALGSSKRSLHDRITNTAVYSVAMKTSSSYD